MPQRMVSFTGCTALKGTQNALLIQTSDGEQVWIPRSQIGENSDVTEEGDNGELEITEWIATEKGLV